MTNYCEFLLTFAQFIVYPISMKISNEKLLKRLKIRYYDRRKHDLQASLHLNHHLHHPADIRSCCRRHGSDREGFGLFYLISFAINIAFVAL